MTNTALDAINSRVVPALALEKADAPWESTLHQSALFNVWSTLRERAAAGLARFAVAGNWLQIASFVLIPILFLILAAPQFANDKEGLAVLVVGAAGLRLLGTLLNGRERYSPSAIDAIVLAFLAMNVIASFSSHYLKESLFGLAKLFVYIVAYFLFVGCFQPSPKKRLIITLSSLVTGALLVSLYGLYQYKIGVAPLATWEDPSIEDKATRVFSTLGNPNLLAGYLIPVVPIAISLAGICLTNKGMWRWLAVPALGVAGVITITTFLTGSRGAYIALIVEGAALSVVAFAWLWRAYPKSRILLVATLLLMPVLAILILHYKLPSFEHRFLSIFAGSEHSSNAYRMNVWRASFAMFKDNWWLGIGCGNKTFRLAYGLYMLSSFDALGTYCVPLEVAVETGIFGLLVFVWMLISCLARAHRRFWLSEDATIRWIAIAGATAIIGMMAHGLVDTVFYRPQVQFIFWLAIAALVALPQSTTQTSE